MDTNPRNTDTPAEVRRLEAELVIVDLYDTIRARLGHDYGAGQRGNELMRRRRELRRLGGNEYPEATELAATELDVAHRQVADARVARLDREDYRAHTPSSRRSRQAWTELAAYVAALAREAGAPILPERIVESDPPGLLSADVLDETADNYNRDLGNLR